MAFSSGPKWRNFFLKHGAVLSVGKLELGRGQHSWALKYDFGNSPRSIQRPLSHPDPSAGGRTLREAMKKLRMEITFYNNPRAEMVFERMHRK